MKFLPPLARAALYSERSFGTPPPHQIYTKVRAEGFLARPFFSGIREEDHMRVIVPEI
jgi:hypothetical protein